MSVAFPCPNCTTHPQRAHMRGPCAAASGASNNGLMYTAQGKQIEKKSRFLRGGRWRHLHCATLLSSRHPTTSIQIESYCNYMHVNRTKVRLEELREWSMIPLATPMGPPPPPTQHAPSDSVSQSLRDDAGLAIIKMCSGRASCRLGRMGLTWAGENLSLFLHGSL
jgi:hypothetical protein